MTVFSKSLFHLFSLDSDEEDGSFNGEESGTGDESEKDSEEDEEDTEEASSETEKRATLNNLNDEQLFGLGASTGHNDNESASGASDSENDDEEDDQESEENNSGEKSAAKSAKKRTNADEAGDADAKKTKQAWFLLASWKKILFCDNFVIKKKNKHFVPDKLFTWKEIANKKI